MIATSQTSPPGSPSDHFDVIIIGSGAGGGTLVHKLAPSGLRILLLERGDYIPRELENWSSREAVLRERYHAPERWLDGRGNEFAPGTHYCVGGNTKFYGAALFRMREQDFGELVHHGGISPAWPIGYGDLEPYYTEAEALYEVRGRRGPQPGSDPTEPPASGPYPHPPVAHEPRIQELSDHFARQGLHPFHTPLGVRLDESRPGRSPCVRCRTCDGFPCLVDAKCDAQTRCVDPARDHPNVLLRTRARALRLETDRTGGGVERVVVERDGAIETYSADVVVVSCGAVNSAALLLRSRSGRHPQGLANGSGLVGRHYMAHNNSVLFAFCRAPNPTRFQKSLSVNDFYFGDGEFPHPMGHISMVGKFDGAMFRTGAPRFVPEFVLEAMGRHSLDFWITSEDLPDPENRVELVPDGGEGRIQIRYRENNLEAHRQLIRRLKRRLAGLEGGALFTKGGKIPLPGVAHQCGTLRFGHDPAASVLDPWCRAHEVSNLYVVDASFFCSSSAVNPALTIMANALRVGDRILDEFRVPQEKRRARAAAHRLEMIELDYSTA